MLTAFLVDGAGHLVEGGEELIDRWRGDPRSRIWVDLDSVDEAEEDRIMAIFHLHHLAIADARRHRHPPKLEVFDDHLFILLRGLDADSEMLEFGTIQLALFAGQRFLLSRHTQKSVSVNHWRQAPELARALGKSGIQLALDISATAARRYLDLLLEFEPRLTELEDELLESTAETAMLELTGFRTRLRKLRRIFSYHTRVFENLKEVETEFFQASDREYEHRVNDVYEKYERAYSLCTMLYELAGDLVEGYISLTNHALNNTMRILTVLTAIFVPLTFLAGIYGMNFEHMPELGWRWSYFVLLAVMLGVMVTLVLVFRRIRWL